MRRKALVGMLFICTAVLLLCAFVSIASASTLYVPDDYSTIQAAVDAANPGDTIIVGDGTYTENVDVNKSHLTIKSENDADKTIVQAANSNDCVFRVTADYVNITGFTVKGVTDNHIEAGLYLSNVKHCNISDNTALNNYIGIKFYESNSNTVTGNKASNNVVGIYFLCSCNNTITGNKASNNDVGFNLHSSSSNTLRNNLLYSNGYNFEVMGSSYSDLNNNIDISNLVDERPIYYLVDASDFAIDSSTNAGTVYCINCENITVKDLDVTNNGKGICFYSTNNSSIQNSHISNTHEGISLGYSSSNIITGNTASNNDYYGISLCCSSSNTITGNTASSNKKGIHLYDSSSNIITGNNASNNTYDGIDLEDSRSNMITNNTASYNNWHGISLDHSTSNTITGNNVSNNYDGIDLCDSRSNMITGNTARNNGDSGIDLSHSSNNKIYLNNFINNGDDVFSYLSANIWNYTEKVAYMYKGKTHENYTGNYWSNYIGSDANNDGIGDEPYTTSGDVSDAYPLMERFEVYFTEIRLIVPVPEKSEVQTEDVNISPPDIFISSKDISFNPVHPTQGDLVRITANIHNSGEADANDFIVSFFEDTAFSSSPTTFIEKRTISVHGNSTALCSILWKAEHIGCYIIVAVDSGDVIEESNEANNEAGRTIRVESRYKLPEEPSFWDNPAAIRLTSTIIGLLVVYVIYASRKK